ncbi:MAG: ATP phosphoribosyltransferase regulatory subunit [Nitrospinae bacterium]|nr:ATP phosphoribosyltransferase regulatory subunit [Nitrospinota bacterium]MBF0633936.1 ATP phosphoribosyltransferase regulatory subunit [Nitrospinota bacterium]
MISAPRGVKSLLYEEAVLKERIERKALALFHSHGYARVETPAMEFLHVLSKGLTADSLKKVITFSDPAGGGKPLALRSDITPQIARIAATTLASRPFPIRLCYAESVFRSHTPGTVGKMEIYQAGAELLGVSSPEADAEIISLAIESLLRMGFPSAQMAISHVGYIESTMDELNLDESHRVEIRRALGKKDGSALAGALDRAKAGGPAREAILRAPSLFGNPSVLADAATVNAGARAAVDNLLEITEDISRYGLLEKVIIDMGETRGMDYYTGVTFEGFVKGLSSRALSGGRYDKLLSLYGADIPATGFAIGIDVILDHLYRTGEPSNWASADALVTCSKGAERKAVEFAAKLRDRGMRVLRCLRCLTSDEAVNYAKSVKVGAVAAVGAEDVSAGHIRIINVKTGTERIVTEEEALARPIESLS